MTLFEYQKKYPVPHHPAFAPVDFKNITLPTRLVRSATELFAALPDGHVPQSEFQTYEKLAEHPLGLIISAHTCVSPEGRANKGQNALWDDEFIDDHAKVTESIHKNGVKIIAQLGHGGMKAKGNNGGREVLTPDTMTLEQVAHVVKAFAAAAVRAKKSGFDGVQLHGAHMYLLSQFFYPEFNHRTDSYGGSAEKRFRIVREIIEKIKTECGAHYPLFIKINGNDATDSDEYFSDLCYAANLCDSLGLDGLELSGYHSIQPGIPQTPYFYQNALNLLEHTNLPVMLVGGIRKKEDIASILASGVYTVSFSRPFLENFNFLEEMFEL